MGYPIRFKLIERSTGKVYKGKDGSGNVYCAILYDSGTPASVMTDFYTYVRPLPCKDYELHVALEKDADGVWIYQKVGH